MLCVFKIEFPGSLFQAKVAGAAFSLIEVGPCGYLSGGVGKVVVLVLVVMVVIVMLVVVVVVGTLVVGWGRLPTVVMARMVQ